MSDPHPPPGPEHDGHGAEQHGHGHQFDIGKAILHHNMPYPAWEPVHHHPLIVFDLGSFAAFNYSHLSHDPSFNSKSPDAATLAWAEQVKGTPDFRWNLDGVASQDLAKAMLVAEQHAPVVFPKALSWLNQQLFFGGIALTLLTLAVCVIWRRKPDQLKPAGRFQHFLESITVYLRDELVRPNFGGHGDHHGHHHHDAPSLSGWTAFFVSLFFMILAVNLFGLIPGTGTLSGNIGVTAAWATAILVLMLGCGLKAQGPAYFINLVPVKFTIGMSPVWFLLLIIESLGLIIKPAALAIRLFANMFAGHTVLLVFLSLGYILIQNAPDGAFTATALGGFGWLLAMAFHAMELLVAFIQAYVFTLLAALFIGMSIHPEH